MNVEKIFKSVPNRRGLLKRFGWAGAAATTAATLGPQISKAQSTNPLPEDVVQFALNLEYLEAEFYSVATTGQTLAARGYDFSAGLGTAGARRHDHELWASQLCEQHCIYWSRGSRNSGG